MLALASAWTDPNGARAPRMALAGIFCFVATSTPIPNVVADIVFSNVGWFTRCYRGMTLGLGNAGCMLDTPDHARQADIELMRRMAAGDQLALRAVYTRHNMRVFQFIRRWLHDAAAAEDVLADVFIDAWQQAARFEGRSSINTWLCAIARYKALNYLRKYPRTEDTSALEDIADESDNPETDLQKSDKGRLLKACLGKLSHEHREVLELIYYHDKSIVEVSEILAIPLNTVKTRMFYARKQLSQLMSAAGIDRGWP
jgi:RNA polymerase sigma-70 factor (ECF subfamily)